ncbi:MAG: hypothetical protein RB148_11835, partial [Armatimonadota bacterium]|nr:hypothetical protein [Armatimonadota bacterium]
MSAAIDLRTVLPEVVVAALAMAVLMWDVLAGVRGRKALAPGTILGLAAAAGAVIWVGPRTPALAGAYLRDAATVLFQAIALISAVLATLLGADYLR